jgi:tetratricopeptide (TPR) repeat protein
METNLQQGDLRGHVEAEEQLEEAYWDAALDDFMGGRFEEASAQFGAVVELNRDLIATLNGANTTSSDDELSDFISRARSEAQQQMEFSDGFQSFAQGQASRAVRDFSSAIAQYSAAEQAFRKGAEHPENRDLLLLAEECRAAVESASGQEELISLNFDAAAARFQRGLVILEDILENLLPKFREDDAESEMLSAMEPYIRQDARLLEANFHSANYRSELANGEYAAAREHIARVRQLVEEVVAGFPSDTPSWVTNGSQTELASQRANEAIATALVCRNEGKWDEALRAYAEARAQLRNAAKFALKTNLPSAQGLQEKLMAQASSLDTSVRACKEERTLHEESDRLRAELISLRSALVEKLQLGGITFQNQNVSTASLEASVEQTANVVQTVTASIRSTAEEFERTIQDTELEPEVRKRLLDAAHELTRSHDDGLQFIERAKEIVRKIADTVVDVGEATDASHSGGPTSSRR